MTNSFLSKTDFDLLIDKKCLCLLTIFASIEYYLTAIANIVLKKDEHAFELKK